MKDIGKAPREKIDGGDACVMMHTALRKCCDSHITTAAYNLIHLLDVKPAEVDPWRVFGDSVAYSRNLGMKASDVIQTNIVEFERTFEVAKTKHERAGQTVPREAERAFWALYSILRCFHEGDIQGMGEYL